MTALTFTLKSRPVFEVDLASITPDKLNGLTKTDIQKLRIKCGKHQVGIADIFSISGSDTDHVIIRKSCNRLNNIGCGMSSGRIDVFGQTGDLLGCYMSGGDITVTGSVADWAGCNMSGGTINIKGNAGNYLGASQIEESHGMSGGMIVIKGSACSRVGDRMRRGTIIIHGNCEEYCGSRMLAGTIIVLGQAGDNPGFAMKRGTIILAKKPRKLSATFKSCGNLKMEFLRLMFKQLAETNRQHSFFKEFGPLVHRYAGDHATSGMGEILILQQ